MRIQVWSTYYWPRVGGTESFLSELLPALRDRGHQFQVITNQARPKLPSRETRKGIDIGRFPMLEALGSRDLAAVRRIHREIQSATEAFRPDWHFLHSAGPLLFFYERVRSLATRGTVLTLHSEEPFRVDDNSTAGRTLQGSHRIVAVSDYLREAFLADHPELEARTLRIWNSCTLPGEELVPLPEEPRILGIGRFIPEKGFPVLLEAFQKSLSALPDLRLELVGDGPERTRLEAMARTLGIDTKVRFTGYLEEKEVRERIDAASAVVMPSLWQEPFGYVALQAMQRARPVIASRAGALPELIEDGHTGRLVPPGNSVALSEAIGHLFQSHSDRKTMGIRAHQRSKERFPFASFLDSYEKVFFPADQDDALS